MTVGWHFSVKEAGAQKETAILRKECKEKTHETSPDMKTFDDNLCRREYLTRTCIKKMD